MSLQRRLSARRGSTSAPDPLGVHSELNLNPSRSISSTLTIVRLPTTPPTNAITPLSEPSASPVLSQRRLHRARPSNDSPSRVSFAFSTFSGNPRPSSPNGPPSPSSSPRLRPSSPHLASGGSSFAGRLRLTPDQVVDLARQATKPVLNTPTTPSTVAPAVFTPLPDDIYLPFIDRSSEVATLISTPPDVKLFSLLAQTFPKSQYPTETSNALDDPQSHQDIIIEIPRDPTKWTYAHLIHHLTQIDRDVAPDPIWAIAARKCILSHSELLWERIKGALGVPPELDLEYDFVFDEERRSESPDTDDISDDEGRAARGHWSDWDAVMDSPIYTRKRLSAGSSAAQSLYHGRMADSSLFSKEEHEAQFKAQIEDRLQDLQGSTERKAVVSSHDFDIPTAGDNTISPTPLGRRTHSPQNEPDHQEEGLLIGNFSPPYFSHFEGTPLEGHGPDHISIEPLLAPDSTSTNIVSANPPPLSLASGDGLGDIAEGAEEEEAEGEAESETVAPTTTGSLAIPGSSEKEDELNLVSPSQIQGLKISTSPMPVVGSYGTPPQLSSPVSPLPSYPPLLPSGSTSSIPQLPSGHEAPAVQDISNAFARSRPHSRTSSFSSIGPFHRTESGGNLASSWSGAHWKPRVGSDKAQSDYASSDYGGDTSSVDGEVRAAGLGPLFVSNFARLAGGPTLSANHPSVRSSAMIPQARYGGRSTKGRAYSHGSNPSGPAVGFVGKSKRESWGSESKT